MDSVKKSSNTYDNQNDIFTNVFNYAVNDYFRLEEYNYYKGHCVQCSVG